MELKILSAGAAKGIVQALAEEFRSSTGATLNGTFGAVHAIREKLDANDPCDVIILTGKMIADLDQKGRVESASRAELRTCRNRPRSAHRRTASGHRRR